MQFGQRLEIQAVRQVQWLAIGHIFYRLYIHDVRSVPRKRDVITNPWLPKRPLVLGSPRNSSSDKILILKFSKKKLLKSLASTKRSLTKTHELKHWILRYTDQATMGTCDAAGPCKSPESANRGYTSKRFCLDNMAGRKYISVSLGPRFGYPNSQIQLVVCVCLTPFNRLRFSTTSSCKSAHSIHQLASSIDSSSVESEKPEETTRWTQFLTKIHWAH